jgi:hypothetical protein
LKAVLCHLSALTLAASACAATLTVQTNVLGPTPTLVGFNSGHFHPGSNTRDWWRYSGVNGARLFISPGSIESSDDFPPRGDGVASEADFLARRTALRAQPLDTNYINWPYFTNRYENTNTALVFGHALRELRELGVESCAQITVSLSRFPITSATDWAGRWELWQHFYAQSFHLARAFGVRRFQMFNEPNHANADGLTIPDFLLRLQLCSDAAQCALTDVNRLEGTALAPLILAPATAGSADGSYVGWGESAVTNLQVNLLGQPAPAWQLIHKYDYHQYNSTPASFGSSLASLRQRLATALPVGPTLPVAISEFNVHTAATFDAMTETLDTPAKYSRFGAIAVNLAQQGCDELYAFKFSQTYSDGSVKKNGLHYVDNDHAPYNIGGITQAGEIWRLFAQAAQPAGSRLAVTRGTGAETLDVLATHLPATRRHALLAVNNTTTPTGLTLNLQPWNLPAGQRVLVAEVSEGCYGAGRLWTNLAPGQLLTGTLPANGTWLLSAPTRLLGQPVTLVATDDAMVKDGANRTVNYGASASLWVKNHSTNANARNVSFLKFTVPALHPPDLEFAVLRLWASAINGGGPVRAHVYGLTNAAWSQSALRWSGAPNLGQHVPPGTSYTNNFVTGAGESAFLLGQVVASGASPTEKLLDVTGFVRAHAGWPITFLVAREVRFAGDAEDNDGLNFISLEGAAGRGPRLDLVRLLDTDSDGLSDDAETGAFHTDPARADTDRDGLGDGAEVLTHGTDPTRPDTDGDGLTDGDEVAAGTDPLDPDSCFRILAFAPQPPEGARLEWSAVSNRLYRVQRSPAVSHELWSEVFAGIATNSRMACFDPWSNAPAPGTGPLFFRILVESE